VRGMEVFVGHSCMKCQAFGSPPRLHFSESVSPASLTLNRTNIVTSPNLFSSIVWDELDTATKHQDQLLNKVKDPHILLRETKSAKNNPRNAVSNSQRINNTPTTHLNHRPCLDRFRRPRYAQNTTEQQWLGRQTTIREERRASEPGSDFRCRVYR